MKTVLVTGCAGFIGWKVSEQLLDEKLNVVGVDNLNDYYDPRLKEWRLSQLKVKNDGIFILHQCDIGDFNEVKKVFSKYKIDAVINLAARAGVRTSLEDPWVYLDTNVKGTLNLLECCKDFGVKKFVLASTSSIYGLNEMPFRETDRTDSPLAPYSATKKGAEVLCYSYHYLYGIDISVPRYFTVYGPAGRPDMSIFMFIKNIDNGIPITVFGDGKQQRDFSYIDDIADGTLKCLQPAGYEIFNLGNDNSVELMYVINLIENALSKKAIMKFSSRHPADVFATWANIEKSEEKLNWYPKTTIEEGIKKTIEWYLGNRELVNSLKSP
ncbi:MAG: nucleotide sugar epimerase [Thermodesulfovibrio sp. RBG_19FT_COMBO_42_12]|nr:MAG: nucleotide sugar epimerase [Thermodesulfovibrio sp. RBG_19FT_COMBO_42_12]